MVDARPTSGDLFSRRLMGLLHGIKGIHPQLPPVLIPWVLHHLRYLPGLVRLARTVGQSHRVRARAADTGVQVPPFLVLSVTSQCNLRCAGCYAAAVGTIHPAGGAAERLCPRPLRCWQTASGAERVSACRDHRGACRYCVRLWLPRVIAGDRDRLHHGRAEGQLSRHCALGRCELRSALAARRPNHASLGR